MTGRGGRQSSAELAGEAEDVRAGLAQTLDQLRDNLRPENMVEEVVGNARVGAANLAEGLYGLARDNPLPALLIGAGCALVMSFGARGALKPRAVLDHEPAELPALPRERVARRPLVVPRRTPARVPDDVMPGFTDTVATADLSAVHIGEDVARPRPLPNTFESTSRQMRDTMKSFGKSIPRSRSQLAGLLDEQPLILAALGVAVGAAIGAALPITETEDEWMGPASSSLRHAAQDAAQSEMEELRDVASRTADNLKQTASDHGLSTDNLNGLVRDAGDHAKAAIHDIGGNLGHAKI